VETEAVDSEIDLADSRNSATRRKKILTAMMILMQMTISHLVLTSN
jgi:hypothetical protein